MGAPDSIYQLIEKFDRDKPGSEDEVQQYFVDPLFEALGWNMRDKRHVRHEPSVTVREAGLERSKRADYSFHIGSARHFFVETKMPHINLQRNTVPAFQLRRYGWSGGTPVSVLTDFEEFCVYDCRIEPNQKDPAATARLRYWTCQNYLDDWDEMESRFSREAVAQGALREWVEGERERGFFSVDQSFLGKMEAWRELLAKDIALHNRDLSQRQLNLLVQRAIDRIVFLRIAEDRDIEAYGRLRSAADEGKQVYQELKRLFIEADDKYNSGLFHFGGDERASEPDSVSLKIHIPDEPLRHIIRNLYFPDSPYEFSVMPPEILGQVYEQFLGKVIELSPGGAVRVEEKPEVRKAGGVYYTPSYIVDYIVENTVGDLLKDLAPAQAAKLRILDPACGSGSFLVGAYTYLLDWHLETYSRAPERHKNVLRRIVGGYVLTTAEKRRILQNNIYGVDLDQNAVEVSKLSLLLKMLENEDDSDATGAQTLMFSAGERILPDLSDNIKWGNSLIGSDFFRGPQATLFDDEEAMLKVKAFDWDSEAGFGAIMAAGGFDVVIGNPPYGAWFDSLQKNYFSNNYEAMVGKFDAYGFFFERGVDLLKVGGFLGYITPHTWLTVTEAEKLRRFFLDKVALRQFVALPTKVFKDATVNTVIAIMRRVTGLSERLNSRIDVLILPQKISLSSVEHSLGIAHQFVQENWADNELQFNIYISNEAHILVDRIRQSGIQAIDLCDFSVGIQAYDKYSGHSPDIIKNRVFHASHKLDATYIKELNGRDVGRYSYNWASNSWVSYGDWLAHPRQRYYFEGPRILVREITGQGKHVIYATYVDETYINYKTILNVLLLPKSKQEGYSELYILGLLNSALLSWYFPRAANKLVTKTFPRISILDIKRFPLRTIDFDNPAEVAMHDKIVNLVDEMLDLHKQLPGLTGEGRRITAALIETVDNEIDALVYKLYGLSDDEVAIVEG